MEKKSKKKLSVKAFRRNGTIAIALILVLAIGATIACNVFSQSLDTYVGRGERRVKTAANIDPDSTNYYSQLFADTSSENGSVAYGLEVSRKITDEGEVLMKNNGLLPLAQGATVTPFGYRYIDPVYGGTGSGNVDSSKDYIVTPQEGLSAFFNINNEIVGILEKSLVAQC